MAGEDGTFISGLDIITCAYNKMFLVVTRLVVSTCMQVGSFSELRMETSVCNILPFDVSRQQ